MMTKHIILSLLLCLVMLLGMVGCSVLDEPTATEPTQPVDPPRSEEELLYEKLFDPNIMISVNISMSPDELQKMQDDHAYYQSIGSKSPIYRRADVSITVDDTTYQIDNVGVRMKGNTSRTDFYDPNQGIYNAIHFKLDFQETFDDELHYGSDAQVWEDKDLRKERKNRTFATLEKLELRWNKCYDSTYLKESYAYELYRSQGVLAPRVNLCSLDWSGTHMGVYTINEPVDEAFLEKRLPAEELGGDLYKCGNWGGANFTVNGSIGIENEDKGEFYVYDLKTNKKTSQHEMLLSLLRRLDSGITTKESFAQMVDVENFLSYAAVSYFVGNPDDLRNNHNNFYLYFLKSSGKAIIIPYDCDRCFGVTVDYDPSGHGLTRDNPFTDLLHDNATKQNSPLYLLSVVKGGYYVKEYADVLTRVSQDILLEPDTFKTWFDRAKQLYGSHVTPNKTIHNMGGRDLNFDLYRTAAFGSGKNISFDDYIGEKMTCFRSFMEKVDEYAVPQISISSGYYIRGDFNDWTNHEKHLMTVEDGYLTYTLSFSHDIAFKIYHDDTQRWMGTEYMSPDTTVPYTSSGSNNIQLKAGTYLVIFDPATNTILLEQQ